jgi:DNA-binding response OmpR family regulator
MIKKKILIVDDEPDITLIFTIVLEADNFIVKTYNDPLLALSNYKQGYFDLVLIDLKMPGMNGFELYKSIRKIDNKTKIGFLTASEQYHEQFRDGEFSKLDKDLFIQKPIENEELIKKINNMIHT